MARLGPLFGPKNLPEKVYVYVPLLRPFPGTEAHKLFSGGQKWGVLDGGQKVYVEKVYVLFRSPTEPQPGLHRTFRIEPPPFHFANAARTPVTLA